MKFLVDDEECIHGLWPATACTICTKKPQPKEVRTFSAKYPGECPKCLEPIEVGDLLAWDGPGTPAIHEECHT